MIWNPDGSTAEMSGNGTRIAARWLAEETGENDVVVRVGPREVAARLRDDGLIEQDMGEVQVFPEERVAGGTTSAASRSATRTPWWSAIPPTCRASGRGSEHRVPRPHERPGRAGRRPGGP